LGTNIDRRVVEHSPRFIERFQEESFYTEN
jgi:hypothetical protein